MNLIVRSLSKMTVHNANISNICEYEWYQWVIFFDQPITYPDPPIVMGQYLSPATDVGSIMNYKILMGNGDYFF